MAALTCRSGEELPWGELIERGGGLFNRGYRGSTRIIGKKPEAANHVTAPAGLPAKSLQLISSTSGLRVARGLLPQFRERRGPH